MAIGVSSTGDGKELACIRGETFGGELFFSCACGAEDGWQAFPRGVMEGWSLEWFYSHMSTGEADCVLAALGLLYMRVKCVIPKELGASTSPR